MIEIKSIKKLGLIVIISQTLIGFMIVFYGTMYSRIDTLGAKEMLQYIQTENPSYYILLSNEEDTSYLREFYKHYTHHGNRKIVVTGLFFLFISGNAAILLFLNDVREKMVEKEKVSAEESVKESEGEEGESGEEGKEGEGGDSNKDDDQSF